MKKYCNVLNLVTFDKIYLAVAANDKVGGSPQSTQPLGGAYELRQSIQLGCLSVLNLDKVKLVL